LKSRSWSSTAPSSMRPILRSPQFVKIRRSTCRRSGSKCNKSGSRRSRRSTRYSRPSSNSLSAPVSSSGAKTIPRTDAEVRVPGSGRVSKRIPMRRPPAAATVLLTVIRHRRTDSSPPDAVLSPIRGSALAAAGSAASQAQGLSQVVEIRMPGVDAGQI